MKERYRRAMVVVDYVHMMRADTAFGDSTLHQFADVARYTECYDSAVNAPAFTRDGY
jgi:hypothetical protein